MADKKAEKKQDPSSIEAKERAAHDETFKTAFREFFADLIELVEPELAATLDLEHAKIQEEDPFADFPGGQVGRADLVAETPTRQIHRLSVSGVRALPMPGRGMGAPAAAPGAGAGGADAL